MEESFIFKPALFSSLKGQANPKKANCSPLGTFLGDKKLKIFFKKSLKVLSAFESFNSNALYTSSHCCFRHSIKRVHARAQRRDLDIMHV